MTVPGAAKPPRDPSEKQELPTPSYARGLIEASLDPLVALSADGKVTDLNRATEIVTGLSREEMIGTDLADYFTDPGKARDGYAQALRKGTLRDFPLAFRHVRGTFTEVLYNASVEADENGTVVAAFVATRDVTALRDSEERFRRLVENSEDAFVLVDPHRRITYASPAIFSILGSTSKEILGAEGSTFVHPDDLQKSAERFQMVLANPGIPVPLSYRLRHRDGTWRWVEGNSTNLLHVPGIGAVLSNMRDITVRIEADHHARSLAERAESLSRISQVLVEARLDSKKVIEGAAKEISRTLSAMCAITLFDDERQTMRPAAVFHPDPEAAALLRSVLDASPDSLTGPVSGKVMTSGKSVFRSRADLDAFAARAQPVLHQFLSRFPPESAAVVPMKVHGRVLGAIAVGSVPGHPPVSAGDLPFLEEIAHRAALAVAASTLHEGLQQELRERRRAEDVRDRLAAIVESSDDAIIGKTLNGVITSWNKGAERMYGYSEAEVVGRSLALLVPEDRRGEVPALIGRIQRGERVVHYETARKTKDGRRIEVSLTLSPILHPSGELQGISAIARDVGARKRAEDALLASEGSYKRIIETTHEGVWVTDTENRTTFVNQRMAQMLGYSPNEMIGHHLYEFLGDEVPKVAVQDLSKPKGGGGVQLELPCKRKDGSVIWALVVTSPILDDASGFLGMLAMFSDITEQRAAQRTREEILDVISHEFRTPVTVIQGYAQMLASGIWKPSAEEWIKVRDRIERSAKHLTALLSSLNELALIRADAPSVHLEHLSTKRVIDEAAEAADLRRPDPLRKLEVEVDAGAAEVSADRRKIVLALAEIIDNAAKFSPKGCPISVRAKVTMDAAVIEVADRGPGIADVVITNLGRPFVQADLSATRRQGGAGLGLALAQGLVKSQGGRIEIERPAGGGSLVRIVLPRA
jgi:PAS domain S-box-containing protein